MSHHYTNKRTNDMQYQKLETFLGDNNDQHTHISPSQVLELYKATRDEEHPPQILATQKIVLACGHCSVVLAESSPVYLGSVYTPGRHLITE